MKHLDLTLPTPEANLALDEALVESADQDEKFPEVLRLWEPAATMVVLGRSSPCAAEVDLDFCRAEDIPVLRRASGGQTIVTGKGCLMYAAVLNLRTRPELAMVDTAHRFVLERICFAIHNLKIACEINGISDLTSNGRKFSGNSLRCRRHSLVYHGTILYGLDPELIAKCLRHPVREPSYRMSRDHREFLSPLRASSDDLRHELRRAWNADTELSDWPETLTESLIREKYSQASWTMKIP